MLLVMLISTATAIGSVMSSSHTNNTSAPPFHAATASDLIVRDTLVVGCAVLAMSDISLKSSRVVIESVNSVLSVIVKDEIW